MPPAGLCRTTWPEGAVEFGADFGSTTKPAACSWLVAVLWLSPTTLGTATFAAPVETNSLTVLFFATVVPNGGLVLITSPLGTVLEGWVTTWETRCAFAMSACAVFRGRLATFGTE